MDEGEREPFSTEKRQHVIDVGRMTEEEMLELALKNSLATDGNAAESSSIIEFEDAFLVLHNWPEGSRFGGY